MRILHVLDHSVPLHSGYSFRTLSILKAQRELGWETFHLTSPKQGDSAGLDEVVDGCRFFRTAPDTGLLSRLPIAAEWQLMAATTRRLEEVARYVKPHLLHAHSPVLNAIPALRVGRRLGLPVVYEVRAFWEDAAVDHGTTTEGSLRYRLSRWLETHTLRRADAVATICEGLRRDIVARDIPERKVTVIPNAVDTDDHVPEPAADPDLRRRLELEGAFVVGFVGSFYAYEGLDLLIGALPDVLQRAPQVRLLLVGGGPQEAALRRQAEQQGVADKVVFTGRVPHGEVARFYSLADVLVFPRRSMRVTELVTPLKPLEAMAHGKPVIASDVGGHRELIRDGGTGLLFKAGDRGALVERIVAAAANPAGLSAMVAAAQRFVNDERTWRLSVDRYRHVYETALASV